MANSERQRGDYFERQTRDALKASGWVVVRSAGSLGPADLVALRHTNRPLLISCKLNGKTSPAERIQLVAAAEQAGAAAILAQRPGNGRVVLYRLGVNGPGETPAAELKVPPRRAKSARDE